MNKENYVNGGLFKSENKWIHPKRCLNSHEIIYVIKGTVYIQEENSIFELHTGDILYLEAGKQHFGTKESENVAFYWCHFRNACTFKQVHAYGNNLNILFRQLLHYENSPQYPRSTLDYVFALIQIEISVTESESKHANRLLLTEIKEWIRLNADKKISVSELSNVFGYNPDYLCRIFKSVYKTPLKQYIEQQRCSFIKSLLFSKNLSLKEISHKAGFDNYQQFLKFFRYHEGISPTAYKNTYYNTHQNKT